MQQVKTGSVDTQPNFFIDGFPFYTVENVVNIEPNHTGVSENDCIFGWNVAQLNIDQTNTPKQYYLYFDTKFDDAFSHWVFESAIFLPFYTQLKEKYPSLKILCKQYKNFKQSFFKAYMLETDVVYSIDTYENVVIFPRYTTHHIRKRDEKHREILDIFYKSLVKDSAEVVKDIDILYLPRGSRENYKGNERLLDCQEKLIEYLKDYPNAMIYYTDSTVNIVEQIHIIRRAKKILLDYGSNFLVNGFFAKNSEIVVIGHDIHHEIFSILQAGQDIMHENGNTSLFIKKEGQTDAISTTFHFSFTKVIEAIQVTK